MFGYLGVWGMRVNRLNHTWKDSILICYCIFHFPTLLLLLLLLLFLLLLPLQLNLSDWNTLEPVQVKRYSPPPTETVC